MGKCPESRLENVNHAGRDFKPVLMPDYEVIELKVFWIFYGDR